MSDSKTVTAISHPDLQGHLADAIRDGARRHLQASFITFDQSRKMADDIIAHFEKLNEETMVRMEWRIR